MPRRPAPPPLSVTLTALRRLRGLSVKGLAAASGVSKNLVTEYESGYRALSRARLDGFAAAMGYEPADEDAVLLGLLRATAPKEGGPRCPVDPTPEEHRRIRKVAADVAMAELVLIEDYGVGLVRATRARRDRRRAADLVRWLLEEPNPRVRRDLVETSRTFQQWAVAESLAHESAKAAAGSAEKALELAELGLRAAELAPGDPLWQKRLQGYAWLFVANARRVGGRLRAAGQGFALARELLKAGAAADPGLLAEWRLPDLEASWRRHQGEFEHALELHEEALRLAPEEAVGRVLLKKAVTLEQMEEPEQALATLDQAEPLIEAQAEPQCLFGLWFNRGVNLVHLERFSEAESLLGRLGEMALDLGHELNGVRLRWLRGRIDAGSRREGEAEAALEEVRKAFRDRGIAYDYAVATLDLAVLYQGRGRFPEVKALAGQTHWIFKAQGVHREAKKALRVFCEAAEAERLTVELARRILGYLERARYMPQLRFEE